MKVTLVGLVMGLSAVATGADKGVEGTPKKKTQVDGYFGLHFDFHAREGFGKVNQAAHREMIEYVIQTVSDVHLRRG
jgi:hypothetical protein